MKQLNLNSKGYISMLNVNLKNKNINNLNIPKDLNLTLAKAGYATICHIFQYRNWTSIQVEMSHSGDKVRLTVYSQSWCLSHVFVVTVQLLSLPVLSSCHLTSCIQCVWFTHSPCVSCLIYSLSSHSLQKLSFISFSCELAGAKVSGW